MYQILTDLEGDGPLPFSPVWCSSARAPSAHCIVTLTLPNISSPVAGTKLPGNPLWTSAMKKQTKPAEQTTKIQTTTNTSPFIVSVWIKPLSSCNILFMTFRILFYIVLQLSNSRECMKVMAVLEMMDEAPCAPHCLQPMSHLLISSAKTDRQLPGISSQSTRLFIFFFFQSLLSILW